MSPLISSLGYSFGFGSSGNAGDAIVLNGLVLYLNAGNSSSYSGSGITWNDLSGSGNNATLINGPTYTTNNGGSLVFDGVNDYANLTSNASITPSNITLFCFVYLTDTRLEQVIAYTGSNNTANGYRFLSRTYKNATGTKWGFWPTAGVGTEWEASVLPLNTWHCLAVTYTPSNLVLYKNAIVDFSTTSPGTLTHGSSIRICQGLGAAQGYLQGRLPIFMMYNRALSQNEINQNFNAFRNRFGI